MHNRMIAAVAILAGSLMGANANSDKALLKGDWDFVSVAPKPKDDGPKLVRVEFAETKVFLRHENECPSCEFDFKLSPDESPKQIDMSAKLEDEDEVQTMKGIYRLDGDSLVICVGGGGGERPTEFKGDDDFCLIHLRRVK